MRFLLKTQAYEETIAYGTYSYRFTSQPVGSDEHWRLSDAAEGYRFFRIDEDARESDGVSVLYHGVLAPDGRWENIKFRYYPQGISAKEPRIEGQLLFEPDQLTLIRKINQERFEDEFDNRIPFVIRGASGLNFFVRWQLGDEIPETILTFGKSFEVEERDFAYFPDADKPHLMFGNSKIDLTLRDDGLAKELDWTDGDLLAKATRLIRVQKNGRD